MKNLISYLLLTVVSIFSINLDAQSSSFIIKESEKFKDKRKISEVLAVHSTGDNKTVIVRSVKKGLIFDLFDSSMDNTFTEFVELEKKEFFAGELFYNNQLKIFSVYHPSKLERILYCHELNVTTKKYKKVELFRTNVKGKGGLFSGKNKRQTNLALSPNKKFLVIATDDLKKHANSYLIHVLNAETLEVVYKKKYYDNTDKFYKSSDISIDNQGAVFLLGKEYKGGRSEKSNARANYQFVLNKVNEEDLNSLKIELDNQHIETLEILDNGEILNIAGFYSEENINRIKGMTIFTINPNTLEVIQEKNFNLPKDVYEDLYGYRKANRKSKKELKNFYLDYIIQDDYGNTYLLAEEFYITTSHIYSATGGSTTVMVYHYDDILILKFDDQGELNWGRSIFKRSGEPSYNAFVHDNKLHVLLNSGKNLKEKEDGRVKASKSFLESSALYDFIYDKNGNVTREKIQDNKGKTLYIPFLGNYNNGKFIMLNQSKNNKQLMLLESN